MKKTKHILILLFVILIGIGFSVISADTTPYIGDTEDLKEAVKNANDGDTLSLDSGFISGEFHLDTETSNKNITIDGQGVEWNKGTFYITGSGRYTLKNINFNGATNQEDYLISVSNTTNDIVFDNISVQNAHGKGGILLGEDPNSTYIFNDSQFNNNTSKVITLEEKLNLTVNRSSFKNNIIVSDKGTPGGVISSKLFSGKININESYFDSNQNNTSPEKGYGGAGSVIDIQFLNGSINIDKNLVSNNKTKQSTDYQDSYNGGAISINRFSKQAEMNIVNSTFDNNLAHGVGGSIYINTLGDFEVVDKIRFLNNTFFENKALGIGRKFPAGGAINISSYASGASKITTRYTAKFNTFVGNSIGSTESTGIVTGAALGADKRESFLSTIQGYATDNIFADNHLVDTQGNIQKLGDEVNVNTITTVDFKDRKTNVSFIAVENLMNDIFGVESKTLSSNHSKVEVGYEKLILPTLSPRPEGLAYNTESGITILKDQRGYDRFATRGAVEAASVKYHANGGTFNFDTPPTNLDTEFYQLNDSNETEIYYEVGVIGKDTEVLSDTDLNAQRYSHEFLGWSTTADALTVDITPGDDIKFTGPTLNLYAVWEEIIVFNVTYTDGLNGQIFENQSFDVKSGNNTPDFVGGNPTRLGYVFNGWTPALEDTVTRNTVYTASWTQLKYTVNFETNGGLSIAPITDLVYGDSISEPSNPTRDGYLFSGWYLDETLTTPVDFINLEVQENMTLYAAWDEIIIYYNVTYKDGFNGVVFTDQTSSV